MATGTQEIYINMQSGLIKDSIKLDPTELTLKTLKEYACNFIDRKVSFVMVLLWYCYGLLNLTQLKDMQIESCKSEFGLFVHANDCPL